MMETIYSLQKATLDTRHTWGSYKSLKSSKLPPIVGVKKTKKNITLMLMSDDGIIDLREMQTTSFIFI